MTIFRNMDEWTTFLVLKCRITSAKVEIQNEIRGIRKIPYFFHIAIKNGHFHSLYTVSR